MEAYYFITPGYKLELQTNVINKTFENLDTNHKNILLDYLLDVIDVIAIKFNFDMTKRDIYEQQFRQNNYRDAIGLLYLLLPFINENVDKSKLKSLNDLYIDKKNNEDINEVAPKYKYSNLEYGRCNRSNETNDIKEIQFSNTALKRYEELGRPEYLLETSRLETGYYLSAAADY